MSAKKSKIKTSILDSDRNLYPSISSSKEEWRIKYDLRIIITLKKSGGIGHIFQLKPFLGLHAWLLMVMRCDHLELCTYAVSLAVTIVEGSDVGFLLFRGGRSSVGGFA